MLGLGTGCHHGDRSRGRSRDRSRTRTPRRIRVSDSGSLSDSRQRGTRYDHRNPGTDTVPGSRPRIPDAVIVTESATDENAAENRVSGSGSLSDSKQRGNRYDHRNPDTDTVPGSRPRIPDAVIGHGVGHGRERRGESGSAAAAASATASSAGTGTATGIRARTRSPDTGSATDRTATEHDDPQRQGLRQLCGKYHAHPKSPPFLGNDVAAPWRPPWCSRRMTNIAWISIVKGK
jgi:hypothetical protein